MDRCSSLPPLLINYRNRVAVVTGANKGIGLEICKQLASNGVFVVLTARDVNRGNEAIETLASIGISNMVFHPLDVVDRTSVNSLADFVKARFGKLDILIRGPKAKSMKEFFKETYESAEKCLWTNYYGIKQVTAALLPLLQQSNLPKVVNVSSSVGQLKYIPGENIKEELNDIDRLTEEKVDGLVARFLKDMKEDAVETGGWPIILSAYIVSKATLNAYTRVLAKKYPGIAINAVHPGYIKTDLSQNIGSPVEEGARGPVTVALMPKDGPSGTFFNRMGGIRGGMGGEAVLEVKVPKSTAVGGGEGEGASGLDFQGDGVPGVEAMALNGAGVVDT
ncbi:hypothetical protein NL676_011286 [Syzygium grande]|nr:hypothetical protein NL676_011286 [Syzygium grande]